jgi:cytochrome b6-f complex iron-sulfur subunit
MTVMGDACGGCGVDRRAFLSKSAMLVAGSLLAASCGDGEIGGVLGPGGTTGLVVTLADFPALATVGGTARVDGGSSRPVAVTRTGAATFVALSMICPHAGYRPIQITSAGFVCPNHGAEFEADGNWVGGQNTRDLSRFTVVFDAGAGTLTIS